MADDNAGHQPRGIRMTAMHELTDPDVSTGVALLRASLNGDGEGQRAIMSTTDPYAMCAVVAGLALALGMAVTKGDPNALDALLADWLERNGGRVE